VFENTFKASILPATSAIFSGFTSPVRYISFCRLFKLEALFSGRSYCFLGWVVPLASTSATNNFPTTDWLTPSSLGLRVNNGSSTRRSTALCQHHPPTAVQATSSTARLNGRHQEQ